MTFYFICDKIRQRFFIFDGGWEMKSKSVILSLIAIIIVGMIATISMIKNINNCDTVENRELRLREIDNLGEVTTIDQELTIDDYVISGYTTKSNRHGLALFAPTGDEKYKFQRNVNRQNDKLILLTTNINQTHYNIFWANKANLDYAEITYTVDGKTGETLTIDAQGNQIIYAEVPATDYNVEYIFVDKNGTRYE